MPGSIVPLPVMLEEEEDRKAYEKLQPPKSMVVRYGALRMIAELPYDGDAKPGCGSKIVIRTRRGIEMAEMLTSTCPNAGCSKSVTRKEMLQYIENSGGKDYPFTTQGKILRVATIDDLNEQARLDDRKIEMIRFAKGVVREMDLDMVLIDVELLLGGERIIFYYTAEQWIDFRELVRRLAAEYMTRIEMHQVNARNEARLVADFEKCGQHCCCKQFLKVLKPVSMRSAKVQKATLDPTKISGRCGRLMCCLRYEDQTYDELRKRLPHKQTRVMTEDGAGTVVDSQILTQLVLVRLDDVGTRVAAYPLEHIEKLTKENDPANQPQKAQKSRGDSQAQEQDRKPRRQPRRPKPGRPLKDEEVESAEGEQSSEVRDAQPAEQGQQGGSEQAEDGAPRKRRRRRRRGRRGKGRKGGDGSGGDSSGGSGGNSGGNSGGGGGSDGGADG